MSKSEAMQKFEGLVGRVCEAYRAWERVSADAADHNDVMVKVAEPVFDEARAALLERVCEAYRAWERVSADAADHNDVLLKVVEPAYDDARAALLEEFAVLERAWHIVFGGRFGTVHSNPAAALEECKELARRVLKTEAEIEQT